ncbi:hypothetical protein [Protaetiibacter larvae]|uniref:Uncharacterized protein n=1 Tax=Protaetiibacter larvae TaxID=2592654 RepID=A0A5C1Y8N4_9MICO|nr:hypothetical protein [Protaetiibacter larvae]QEO09585.1 hypothetical protein FLP23_05935 [Protaetiibacter larvae]
MRDALTARGGELRLHRKCLPTVADHDVVDLVVAVPRAEVTDRGLIRLHRDAHAGQAGIDDLRRRRPRGG